MTHEPTCGIIEVNGTLTVDDLAKHQARYMPTNKETTTMNSTLDELTRMVRDISDDLSRPEQSDWWADRKDEAMEDGYDEPTASLYLDDVYDVRYIIGRDMSYLGSELMVAGGGPTIWINTLDKRVEGYWGGTTVDAGFIDAMDIDGYMEEMYDCQR